MLDGCGCGCGGSPGSEGGGCRCRDDAKAAAGFDSPRASSGSGRRSDAMPGGNNGASRGCFGGSGCRCRDDEKAGFDERRSTTGAGGGCFRDASPDVRGGGGGGLGCSFFGVGPKLSPRATVGGFEAEAAFGSPDCRRPGREGRRCSEALPPPPPPAASITHMGETSSTAAFRGLGTTTILGMVGVTLVGFFWTRCRGRGSGVEQVADETGSSLLLLLL
mmetsp:Transcript_20512/g.48233  ORF Transcript_20512/g.48233 Transcript_20512/m.48233 type:complete len:219 (-) Transcript_20512:857-1513(-)